MVGDGAATLVARAFAAAGIEPPARRARSLSGDLRHAAAEAHAAVSADAGSARRARRARAARRADQQAARATRRFSRGSISRDTSTTTRSSAATDRSRASRIPAGLRHLVVARRRSALRDAARRRFAGRLAHRAHRRDGRVSGALRVRVRGLSDRTSSALTDRTDRRAAPSSWRCSEFCTASRALLSGFDAAAELLRYQSPMESCWHRIAELSPSLSLSRRHCASPEVP